MKLYASLLSLMLLSACATEPVKPPVSPQPTIPEISPPAAPRPVSLRNVDFYVVTEENYDDFVQRFTAKNGELVFIAMSVDSYENMSLNLADLRRYIQQQKSIIVYYEKTTQEIKKINTPRVEQ